MPLAPVQAAPQDAVLFQPGPPVGPGGSAAPASPPPVIAYRLPALAADDHFEGMEDEGLAFSAGDLLSNDLSDYGGMEVTAIRDVQGGNITWVPAPGGNGGGGAAQNPPIPGLGLVDEAGYYLFTPDADFAGVAHFTYAIMDGRGHVSEARGTIRVQEVNDAPVVQ